jgi:hypothetical protein
MLYYYKRPGDWLWRQLDTDSIAAAARGHRVGTDWRYRVEGDSTNRTLAELIEMEQLAGERASHTPADPSFVAPDGTWGYITVALCTAALALLAVIPAQSGHSSDKLILVALALIWISYGVQQISAANAWKRRHPPYKGPNQTLQPTAGRRTARLKDEL